MSLSINLENAEVFDDYERDIPELDDGERKAEINFYVVRELTSAKAEAPPCVVKGIDAMLLMAKGYTCREIGEKRGSQRQSGERLCIKSAEVLEEPSKAGSDDGDIRGVKNLAGYRE